MADSQISIAQHYHDRTKYDPHTLAQNSRALDFATQPPNCKEYKIGTQLDLKPYLNQPAEDIPTQKTLQRLSYLLYHSYGITGMIPYPGQPFYMRAAPSAGGLYPAELYVIARDQKYLSPGLYNYQVQTHSLCHFWSDHVWSALEEASLWHPALRATQLAIVITAVFYRSVWRYEDRAYRRIFLDSGHLLGNLELVADLLDYRAHQIGGFWDESLNQMLYLDEQQEGAIAVIALADLLEVDQNLPQTPTTLPSETDTTYPAITDGTLLPYCHHATQIHSAEQIYSTDVPQHSTLDKYNFPFCQKFSTHCPPIDWGQQGMTLLETIRQRRSTRRYTGEALSTEELLSVLDFTYHPENYAVQGFDTAPDFFDLSLVETFVAVSDVKGLEAGCYYYAVHAQELRQIRFNNFRRELYHLCLMQDLGRDAAAVIFHTANLSTAIDRHGDRAYRYLHMDAGHLGQRLNLAAIHLDLGVSGIGGFFDNQVNELLDIPPEEAVLYITTLGRSATA
jgi:SagB-type dehydrogenase family enzyme